MSTQSFPGPSELLSRLTNGLKKRRREVVLLVGSPFSAATVSDGLGVPSVAGMIDLIRSEFDGEPNLQAQLADVLSESSERRYQEAFGFLQSHRGQVVANELVRQAVLSACAPAERYRAASGDEQACSLLEADNGHWTISPATQALAELAVNQSHLFGKAILTTNFDPLIEVAMARVGGRFSKTVLQGDGDLSATTAPGCQVVHLHGYWYGSNTFHTIRQLTQQRPQLKSSLIRLLKSRLVVVCAYGGWDDIFTSTLLELTAGVDQDIEIVWTTLSKEPQFPGKIQQQMNAASDSGKIAFYSGIDCNLVLPELSAWWKNNAVAEIVPSSQVLSPVHFAPKVIASLRTSEPTQMLEGDDEDRPPIIEHCVGRGAELELLEAPDAPRVVFITGLGGQGKSTLAAKVFVDRQKRLPDEIYVWRDCKEETERFENQLASVIESLTSGRVRGRDLAKQSVDTIVEIVIPLLGRPALFVFDNIDRYIDLEGNFLNPNVAVFVNAVLERTDKVRLIFTSRPSVELPHSDVATIRLEGLSLTAAKQLFTDRLALSSDADIESAHTLTDGHAFWLDLLAIRVARSQPPIALKILVEEIRAGVGDLPTKVLQSTWGNLKDRERIVLRAMAETVRPERENEIAEYVKREMHFHKVFKALKSLRSANLVVVKKLRSDVQVLELHLLVRTFIRQQFSQKERISFIDGIIQVYNQFIGSHRDKLLDKPTFVVLQNWTQAAELRLAAGRLESAYSVMAEAISAFSSSAYPRIYEGSQAATKSG